MQPDSPAAGSHDECEELLRLRLKKTQFEAEAARLQALATEIEILLRTTDSETAERSGARRGEGAGWEPYLAAARAHLAEFAAPLDAMGDDLTPESAGWKWTDIRRDGQVEHAPEADCAAATENEVDEPNAAEGLAEPTSLSAFDEVVAGVDDPSQRLKREPRDAAVVVDAVAEPQGERRRRRSVPAWLISVVAHIIIFLLLAVMTFQVAAPSDAIALAATSAALDEPALESMTFESIESPEAASAAESAAVVELADIGEVPAAVAPIESALSGAGQGEAELESFASDFSATHTFPSGGTAAGETATLFCGIEGGGNNFCYIVDSSQSMAGGRFEAARNELLRSIDALPSEKRFYVIFYDSNLDPMRFDGRAEREPFAVSATMEHKAALRRWAMTVELERGAPPDDALELALELEPDVIFLLTDGEFPERIETLLSEKNRVQSLFGDEGPKSIIHTIGFHSRDGESRLKRIAKDNGGRYQYIADSR